MSTWLGYGDQVFGQRLVQSCCEGILYMGSVSIWSVDFDDKRLPFMMWVGPWNQCKALRVKT